jgi:transcriptional regulator with XRE-family HTH domain
MKNYKEPRKRSNPRIAETLANISPTEKAKTVNKMLFAARLSDLISQRNLSKVEFAKKVNQEPSVITKWLSGTHNFTMDTQTEIAIALSISLDELIAPKQVQIVYKSKIEVVSHNLPFHLKEPQLWQPPDNCEHTIQTGTMVSSPFLFQEIYLS